LKKRWLRLGREQALIKESKTEVKSTGQNHNKGNRSEQSNQFLY